MSADEKNPHSLPASGGEGLESLRSDATVPATAAASYSGQSHSPPYGALPGEWEKLGALGLTDDLLPVVSDPSAVPAPESTIKQPGKLPSIYRRDGHMVGFAKWTEHHTTPREIAKWAEDDRLGICLNTRLVRAIDVDVEDLDEAIDIEIDIAKFLGVALPIRRRSNSSKFLVLFKMPGDFTKRRFKTAGGVIEFLAGGQQAVVCGTHPSGVRYEFDGGLPDHIPPLDTAKFEALWALLNEKLGIEASVEARKGIAPVKPRSMDDVNDPLVDYLEVRGLVLDYHHSGRLDITCPFADDHTTESGNSSTSYFPAGVGGFQRGHFDCKHSHCSGRTDGEFKDAIGWSVEGFEEIEDEAMDGVQLPAVIPPPNFSTIKSGTNTGKVKNNLENVVAALFRPDVCGYRLQFDNFRHGVMLSPPGADEWRAFTDEDYTALRLGLCRPGFGHDGFEEIGKETIRDAVAYVADKAKFDSAILWLDSLEWDGTPRIENFISRYFGAADTDYTRAIGLYIWTALAGRVLVPGIKADMAPVAVGKQGAKKSSTVAAMVPAMDFFIEADLSKNDDDLSRLMRGKLVIELGELKGLRKREAEHIKAFIVKQHEEWTPKFREFNTRYARRCIFFGTTNEPEFLVDKTGHRRWLPFDCGECDPAALAVVRDQLWAEGRELFKRTGIMWNNAEVLARDVHEQYVDRDPWEESVIAYLETTTADGLAVADTPFTSVQVLQAAIGKTAAQITRVDKYRMGGLLANIADKLSLKKCKRYINGVQQRGFVREVQ